MSHAPLYTPRPLITFADDPPAEAPPAPVAPADPVPLPGTPQREALLRGRAGAGQELHQPGDVVSAPDQRTDYRRTGNGQECRVRDRGVVAIRPEPGEKAGTIGPKKTATKQMYELVCPGLKLLGRRLVALRGGRTRGQIELASGVQRSTLRKLEEGLRPRPRVDTLIVLADFYGVSLDELVGRRAP